MLGLYLYQCKYAVEIIFKAGLTGVKTVSTLIEPNHKVAKSISPLFYMLDRRLIGKFIHLILNRPELTYAMYTLVQFMHCLRSDH